MESQERDVVKPPLEIRHPQVDTDEVLSRLYANLSTRAYCGEEHALPDFELPPPPEAVEDATLRYHLARARALHRQTWVGLSLAPSPGTRVPVLGRIWGMIREQMHRLILYYVDMAVSKQVEVNTHLVASLTRLAEVEREIVELRREVAALRRRVEDSSGSGDTRA